MDAIRDGHHEDAVVSQLTESSESRCRLARSCRTLPRGESFPAAFEQRFFQSYESFITNVEAAH